MDERLKYITDNFDNLHIGLDDTFRFHCDQCGKCCIEREDILLNPKDIFNVSRELELTPLEAFDKYCETYIGSDSRIPIVRLKPRGSIKRCPLLKDRKCSVHRAKPTVCALFPLGRCVRFNAKKMTEESFDKAEIQYILNPIMCGDASETHTVRDWLESFGLPVRDESFLAWQKVMFRVRKRLVKLEKKLTTKAMEYVWSITWQALYIDYDIHKEFDEQFRNNTERLVMVLDEVPRMWEEARNAGRA